MGTAAVSAAGLPTDLPTNLPVTLPAMLRRAAHRHGQRPAVVDGEVTLSFAALAAQAERAARSLIALGVQAAERVAIWAPNLHPGRCGTRVSRRI